MKRPAGIAKRTWAILLAGIFLFALGACDGSEDATAPPEPQDPAGPEGPPGTGIEPLASAKTETCATCHGGVGEEVHQAIYDKYVDASALAMTFSSVTSVANGDGTFTVTLAFSIAKNGAPFVDAAGLPSMDQASFYAVTYDSATRQYANSKSMSRNSVVPGASPGDYILTQPDVPYAPELSNAHVYGYVAQGALLTHEGGTSELPEGTHVHLYDDVANTAIAFGTADVTDANAYVSAANVAGCQNCHGQPYMKHGYRAPEVAGLPDFGGCKSCHFDNRTGGHEDWQYMVDDPLNWATAGLPEADVETTYAYKASLMNDVHMAHAMEFPYPQSMANCATCHEGKLDQVLANTNFTLETCKSCHPVQGIGARPGEDYNQPERAPALEYLWAQSGVEVHRPEADCQLCHGNTVAPAFNELHSGYDVGISNAAGERYSDLYTASIDDVSLAGDVLTIAYSASDPAIVPELLVSFYGWDSKHYIVPSHARDNSGNCPSRSDPTRGCRFEYEPGDTNPLFPSFEEVAPGSYVLTADMAQWLDGQPGFIPDLIADGVVKKVEITVTPQLELTVGEDQVDVVLNAVGQTFDLVAGTLVDDYFKGDNATVDTDKCNVCHDSLASSFHDGSGRGGGGIQVCKNCHNPTFPGSHLEMASRSIDDYVHAIHSFQDFDTDDTFEVFDPVLAKRYDQHINHVFPNFTIRNCEACHLEGTYNVPDQSRSMPGVLSASNDVATWYDMADVDGNIPNTIAVEDPAGRNISGSIPEFVTGPASRACGGCHRANLINADAAGDLDAFNAHTEMHGTYIENEVINGEEDTIFFDIIDKIMSPVE